MLKELTNNIRDLLAVKKAFGVIRKVDKDTIPMLIGLIVSQLITFAALPAISKLYTPEENGVLGIFIGVVNLLLIPSFGKFDGVIFKLQDRNQLKSVLWLCLFVLFSIFVILLTALAIYIFVSTGPDLILPSHTLINIPIHLMFSAILSLLLNIIIYDGGLKWVVKINVSVAAFSAIAKILFGYLEFGSSGLIYVAIIGTAVGVGIGAAYIFTKLECPIGFPGFESIRKTAWTNRDFPMYAILHAYMDSLRTELIVMLIAYFYGKSQVGLYLLASSIVMAPMGLVTGSIAQIYVKRAGQEIRCSGNLFKLSKDTLLLATLMSIAIGVPIMLFKNLLFNKIFATQWLEAGLLVTPIVLAGSVRSVNSVISTLPSLVGRQRDFLIACAGLNIVPAVIISTFGLMKSDFKDALFVSSLLQMILSILLSRWLINLSKNQLQISQ